MIWEFIINSNQGNMESINEYMHYYIGQKLICVRPTHPYKKWDTKVMDKLSFGQYAATGRWKLLLRRLEDMTEEEAEQLLRLQWPGYKDGEIKNIEVTSDHGVRGLWWSNDYQDWHKLITLFSNINSAQFHHLLSRGFWLFGDEAFDKGLIIDAKTLQV